MPVETITMLVGIVSVLAAIAGGFGWMMHRSDAQFILMRGELSAMRSDLGARIDASEARLGARIDKVADELVEVKIAVARIEGTPRHLITGR